MAQLKNAVPTAPKGTYSADVALKLQRPCNKCTLNNIVVCLEWHTKQK